MASTDPSLGPLIALARDGSAPTRERHHAFAEIVRRCEDLVFACAFARLHDPALAEDAAQDAFLLAWQRLDQLREPAAFPGWIRRLTLSQCHRRLRSARLRLRPADEASELAAATDPAADVQRAADASLVRLALAQLAPADRLVLVLTYGCERSQAEIADWLGVPVTTVARRLAHAKRRMRRHAVEALAGRLRACRHAREDFVVDLAARMRAAAPADAAGLANLAAGLGLEPTLGVGGSSPSCAFLVEDPASGAPLAYAAALPTAFRPIYSLQLAIGEEALARHAGDVLLTEVLEDLAARDAISLQHRVAARHAAVVAFLGARGFEVVERAQDWRLHDGAPPATVAAPEAAADAWELGDVEELSRDAALFASALELLTETLADDPTERAFLPIHPDMLRRGLRWQTDGVAAIRGARVDGLIAASADDVVPHALRLRMVVVRKAERRRGLARAILARLRAGRSGAPLRLVAPAAGDLAAWLGACGFVQVSDMLLMERLLRKTVAIAPELLDDYVGRYLAAAYPDSPILIERHGDSLISKARDMRDVLLASSPTEFFTRHHYGWGRFERDESGRVARLVYRDGPRELVAMRR
jgi:RNA polymerase sigma factor (sigma-70 family)